MKGKEQTKPTVGIDEVMNKLNDSQNPIDKAFGTMSENIWKKEMLRQMNRFDKSQIMDIMKNYIVMLLYEKQWREITVSQKVVKTKYYPYYRVNTNTIKKSIDINEFMKESTHSKVLDIITELYIGVEGKARGEVFGFITSYAKALEETRLNQKPPQPNL